MSSSKTIKNLKISSNQSNFLKTDEGYAFCLKIKQKEKFVSGTGIFRQDWKQEVLQKHVISAGIYSWSANISMIGENAKNWILIKADAEVACASAPLWCSDGKAGHVMAEQTPKVLFPPCAMQEVQKNNLQGLGKSGPELNSKPTNNEADASLGHGPDHLNLRHKRSCDAISYLYHCPQSKNCSFRPTAVAFYQQALQKQGASLCNLQKFKHNLFHFTKLHLASLYCC